MFNSRLVTRALFAYLKVTFYFISKTELFKKVLLNKSYFCINNVDNISINYGIIKKKKKLI